MKQKLTSKTQFRDLKRGKKMQQAGFAYKGIPVQYVQNSREMNKPQYYYKDNKGLAHYINEADLDKVDKFGNFVSSDGTIYSGSGNGHTITYVNRKSAKPKIQKYYTGRDGKSYEAYQKGDDWMYRERGTNNAFQIIPRNYRTIAGYDFYSGKYEYAKPTTTKVNPKIPRNNRTTTLDPNRFVSTKGDTNAFNTSLQTEGLTNRDQVKAYQQKLIDVGFDITADGIWGANTENAYQSMLAKNKSFEAPQLTNPEVPQFKPTNFEPNNYNRSDVRGLIRNTTGNGAYSYSGAQRAALRHYLNGESNDTTLLNNGLEKFIGSEYDSRVPKNKYSSFVTFGNTTLQRDPITGKIKFRKGGLISRNPIERYKNKK